MLFETEYINNTHDQEVVISFFVFSLYRMTVQ